MKDYQLPPDDPRLTAYALGELEGEERAAVEAALRRDPGLRATVEQIRATAAQLEDALANEPAPSVFSTPPMEVRAGTRAPMEAAAIIPGDDSRKLDGGPLPPRNVFRFPRTSQLYYIVGGLAAACFALVVVLRENRPTPAPVKAPVKSAERAVAMVPAPAVELPSAASLSFPGAPSTASAGSVAAASGSSAAPATAADVVNTVPPVADPALEKQAFNANRISLLDQAKSAEESANNPGVMPAPVPAEPRVAIMPAAVAPVLTAVDQTTTAAPVEPQTPAVAALAPVAVSSPPPAAASVATTLLPRSTGSLTLSPDAGGVGRPSVPPVTTSIVAGGSTPAGETISLSRFLQPSSALVEGARDALLRPLSLAHTASRAAAAVDRDNSFITVTQNPISAFVIESENSSYAAVRRFLQLKRLPPRDTVRIEELVNYFPYHYPAPRGDAPFAASMEVADAPWAPTHRLVRIGLKAREIQAGARPAMNVVFVVDVVDADRLPSRLPLIKESIQSLVGKLRPEDRVSLVSCRDQASLLLNPTPAAKSREIVAALEKLVSSGGTTSRMKGIQIAYETLQSAPATSSSRVILCTDGNAGISITAEGPLARFIEGKARTGVALTAFAFGMGIYRDPLIEFLAEWGSGNYGYIDTRRDAEKMLAEDVNGPAITIAKDVKIEVEFNPARVASYRLIGYENRELGKDDFKAGSLATDEVSAGHAVTALFEIVPADGRMRAGPATAEGLRYQPPKIPAINLPTPNQNELLTVKVRYKKPGGAISRKLDLPVADSRTRFVDASADFKFAAAVAGFGMLLRDSPHKGDATLAHVIEWAEAAAADDPAGFRGEFVELAREAQSLIR